MPADGAAPQYPANSVPPSDPVSDDQRSDGGAHRRQPYVPYTMTRQETVHPSRSGGSGDASDETPSNDGGSPSSENMVHPSGLANESSNLDGDSSSSGYLDSPPDLTQMPPGTQSDPDREDPAASDMDNVNLPDLVPESERGDKRDQHPQDRHPDDGHGDEHARLGREAGQQSDEDPAGGTSFGFKSSEETIKHFLETLAAFVRLPVFIDTSCFRSP